VTSIFTKQSDISADSKPATSAAAAVPATVESSVRSNSTAAAESRTLLERGSKIVGKASFEGPVVIEGEVEGEITGKQSVTIGASASVTAEIRAASVLIAGKVSGHITASERIELGPSAWVEGDLFSAVLAIQEGAYFEGRASMPPESARNGHEELEVSQPEASPNGPVGQNSRARSVA
jgi:cytoskeletal protein CcmA (bactofilin family)